MWFLWMPMFCQARLRWGDQQVRRLSPKIFGHLALEFGSYVGVVQKESNIHICLFKTNPKMKPYFGSNITIEYNT